MGTKQTPRFVRVTKSNKAKDRGFIAIDAICSVFENQETHSTSIMTMDGFWYDVVDDVEKLYAVIAGSQVPIEKKNCTAKKDYYRRKKMLPPNAANSEVRQAMVDGKNRDLPTGVGEGQHTMEVSDVFTPPRAEIE